MAVLPEQELKREIQKNYLGRLIGNGPPIDRVAYLFGREGLIAGRCENYDWPESHQGTKSELSFACCASEWWGAH